MFNIKAKFIATSIIALTVATAINAVAHDSPYYTVDKGEVQSDKYDHIIKTIARNQQDKFNQLLNSGFDINTLIPGDGTPLIIAIQHNQNQLALKLIEQGADIELSAPQDGNPLINAAIHNNLEMAKILLSMGAAIDAIVEDDETALISAARGGHTEMVKLLVAHGADVNLGVNAKTVRGLEYRTPLNGAKNTEIANYLIEQGAKA